MQVVVAAGAHVVSPQWMLQSLDKGSLQRCAHISLDALRSLPPPSITAPAKQYTNATFSASGRCHTSSLLQSHGFLPQ